MVALLLYAYCLAVRSYRQIERACHVDVAFRVICAGLFPDHTTIAHFRQRHVQVLKSLFSASLRLCHRAGLAKVGTVALDGTKMAAAASMQANAPRRQSTPRSMRCLPRRPSPYALHAAEDAPGRGPVLANRSHNLWCAPHAVNGNRQSAATDPTARGDLRPRLSHLGARDSFFERAPPSRRGGARTRLRNREGALPAVVPAGS